MQKLKMVVVESNDNNELGIGTYLKNYEPDELVHFSRGTYMTRTLWGN